MAAPPYSRSLTSAFKRLKLSPTTPSIAPCQIRLLQTTASKEATSTEAATTTSQLPSSDLTAQFSALRLPKAVQATYLNPLRRTPTHNIPCADLQLRSYSVRNLDLFADFAMRAAYFLSLPAKGPIPMPRITERWTVPRSNFVHKKSQENFERRTMRRAIRIVDGHPETVGVWLAFLKKHQYYGVGMKADVWESGGLETGGDLDAEAERIKGVMGQEGEGVRVYEGPSMVGRWTDKERVEKLLREEPFKAQWGADAAMVGNARVSSPKSKIPRVVVEGSDAAQRS